MDKELENIFSALKTMTGKNILFNDIIYKITDLDLKRENGKDKITSGGFSFYYVLSNDISIFLSGNTITVPQKKIVLIPPRQSHEIYSDGAAFFALYFSVAQSSEWESNDFVNINNAFCAEVKPRSFDLSKLANRQINPCIMPVLFFGQIYELLSTCTQTSYTQKQISEKAIEYINRYYGKQISMNDIAKKLSFSYRHLARIFKKETGKTLSDELNEIRIQHAKKLLASTALSINEISKMIGYENECYFSAVFKRYTDTTPSEFRKNQKHSGT